jgi:5-(carboxyamino)imidazole ribonucleotide synthase
VSEPIGPGATVGMIGGGQLGRMFTAAAHRLGYRVAVWSDAADAPALAAADLALVAPYDDEAALDTFTGAVAAATVEFENLPSRLLERVGARVPLRPSAAVVATVQHRGREKAALAALGVPLAPWRALGPAGGPAAAAETLGAAVAALPRGVPGRPLAVLKTAGFGYDGKGQVLLGAGAPWPAAALDLLGREACVVESFVDLAAELSVVVARGDDGLCRAFPVAENHHAHHVLDLTLLPARIDADLAGRATALAERVVAGLGVVGLACVELFLTRAGELWVNEVAPRPHNSGHVTLEACRVDQFEQQLRAVCGLPLGDPSLVRPGAMANLLGEVWQAGEPDWSAAMAVAGVRLHLYGKREARPGRKMGHLSAVGEDAAAAARLVVRARVAARGAVGAGPAGSDDVPPPPALAAGGAPPRRGAGTEAADGGDACRTSST